MQRGGAKRLMVRDSINRQLIILTVNLKSTEINAIMHQCAEYKHVCLREVTIQSVY